MLLTMDTAYANTTHNFNGNICTKHLEMDQPSSKPNFIDQDPYDTYEDFDYDEMKQEIKRIATFRNWPQDSPVKALDLAAAGFFYLGKDDSVKCFSCEVHLKQWVAGDNPFVEHKKHKPNCLFVKTYDKSDEQRATSQPTTPVSPATDLPGPLPNRSGHPNDPLQHIAYPPSYRMNLEQLPQPSQLVPNPRFAEQAMLHPAMVHPHFQISKPSSMPTQQPIQATSHPPEHLHLPFPAGPYIPGQSYNPGRSNSLPGHLAISPLGEQLRSSPVEPLSASWSHPVATDYSDYNSRILSYKHWPAKTILRPTELAQAGFYYTGFDDGVTCYNCKVSLKGWEPNDTPWGEHKKWSPNCPLVLEHFTQPVQLPGGSQRQPSIGNNMPVSESQTLPRNVPRPRTSPGWHLLSPEDFRMGTVPSQPSPFMPSVSGTQSATAPPPSSVQTRLFQGLDTGNLTQNDLDRVSDMGFSENEIREVFKAQAANAGTPFANIDDLVQALLYHQGFQSQRRRSGGNSRTQEPFRSSPSDGKPTNPLGTEPSNDNMKRELERMQEARLCKICMDEDVGIVFLPCGHLVCCPDCAHGLKTCPMCRGDITDTIRTYFS